MWIGIKRVIKAGFVNFSRSGIVGWAAVLVMTITLSVIAGLLLLQAVLHSSLTQIKEKVDVTIYFHTGAEEEEIETLQNSLERLPEVASVSYTTAEQALADFRERHKNDYSTLAALEEIKDNPLGAYLNVKAKEVSQYETIANFLRDENLTTLGVADSVDKINYHQNKLVIDRLNSIIGGASRLGLILTLVLVAISIIITFNTIRLTIYISKEEIGVMRLVGASKMGVRGPFMIEGAIYGVISTLFTLLLFWPIVFWLGHNMTGFLGLDVYEYYRANFFQIFAIILISGILLGIISSFLAIRKYLNK